MVTQVQAVTGGFTAETPAGDRVPAGLRPLPKAPGSQHPQHRERVCSLPLSSVPSWQSRLGLPDEYCRHLFLTALGAGAVSPGPAGLVSPEASVRGVKTAIFSLGPHVPVPVCICILISSSYKDTCLPKGLSPGRIALW